MSMPFRDHVEVAVFHDQLDVHLRITRDEAWHRRHDTVRGEPHTGVHEELSARLLAGASNFQLRILELRDDAAAAREEQGPLGRRGELARRAVEEAHPEHRLEPRHHLRERGGRELQVARGRGKAAALHGAHERLHLSAIPDRGSSMTVCHKWFSGPPDCSVWPRCLEWTRIYSKESDEPPCPRIDRRLPGSFRGSDHPASAAEFPTKPVRIVVPNPPGGTVELVARAWPRSCRRRSART